MTLLFVISKAVTRRGSVKLSDSRADLQRAIENLRAPKEERKLRRLQSAPTRVCTERIEEQAAMQAPEIRQGGAALLKPDDSLHAESSQSGNKPSSGGGSTAHSEE